MKYRGIVAIFAWLLATACAMLVIAGCGREGTLLDTPTAAPLSTADAQLPTSSTPAPQPTEPVTASAVATAAPPPTEILPTSPPPSQTPVPVLPPPTATMVLSATPLLPTLAPVDPGLITNGSRSRARVALTFDACEAAGSPAGYDEAIIRVLTETQTAATLFLGGLWAQSHPGETQLLASIPYFEVGNHSWSHPDLAKISEEEMVAEITKTQEILFELTGRQPVLFRLPFGTYTQQALDVIARLGLRTIQWDVVSGDTDPEIDAEEIVRTVKAESQNGSIILMHMNGQGWHTAEALPTVISELEKLGFDLVTVSELLAAVPASPTPSVAGNAAVNASQVRVRKQPSTSSQPLGTLDAGRRITVLCSVVGEKVAEYGTDLWYRVGWREGSAYILSALVKPDGPVAPCQE